VPNSMTTGLSEGWPQRGLVRALSHTLDVRDESFFRLQSSNSFPDTATTEIESQSSDRPVPRCLSYRGPMKGGRHLAFCDCIRCRGKRSRMQTCEKKGTPRVHLGANQETRPRSLITPVLNRWISKFATCASFSARRLRVATSLNWPPRPGPNVLV
jgi:hypothetical protein